MNLKTCSLTSVHEFVSIGLFLNEEAVRSPFIGIPENGVEELGKCWILRRDRGGVSEQPQNRNPGAIHRATSKCIPTQSVKAMLWVRGWCTWLFFSIHVASMFGACQNWVCKQRVQLLYAIQGLRPRAHQLKLSPKRRASFDVPARYHDLTSAIESSSFRNHLPDPNSNARMAQNPATGVYSAITLGEIITNQFVWVLLFNPGSYGSGVKTQIPKPPKRASYHP